MGEGDQLRFLCQQAAQDSMSRRPSGVIRNGAKPGSSCLGQHLPRHDVGVMFHGGEDDQVAGADVRAAPGLGHQVDRLGGVPHENDFTRRPGIDERCDLAARVLVR